MDETETLGTIVATNEFSAFERPSAFRRGLLGCSRCRVLYGIAAALPAMKQQKSGHIINVSSVAGHKVRAGGAVYSATKHAVLTLSEGLRQEVKPYNIRTTVISPGAVATELPDSVTEADLSDSFHKFYEEFAIPGDSFARCVAFA